MNTVACLSAFCRGIYSQGVFHNFEILVIPRVNIHFSQHAFLLDFIKVPLFETVVPQRKVVVSKLVDKHVSVFDDETQVKGSEMTNGPDDLSTTRPFGCPPYFQPVQHNAAR